MKRKEKVTMNNHDIWTEFLNKIKSKVSLMSYNCLFKDLKLHSYENNELISATNPRKWKTPSLSLFSGLPRKASIITKTILPPSSAGKGKRFTTPRFMLIRAAKDKTLIRLCKKL